MRSVRSVVAMLAAPAVLAAGLIVPGANAWAVGGGSYGYTAVLTQTKVTSTQNLSGTISLQAQRQHSPVSADAAFWIGSLRYNRDLQPTALLVNIESSSSSRLSKSASANLGQRTFHLNWRGGSSGQVYLRANN